MAAMCQCDNHFHAAEVKMPSLISGRSLSALFCVTLLGPPQELAQNYCLNCLQALQKVAHDEPFLEEFVFVRLVTASGQCMICCL